MVNPEIPENTRHTRKYPKYPEIPESKKDIRKYPIVNFDTPTRPESDPLPGILSNTRPDPILKKPYPLGTGPTLYSFALASPGPTLSQEFFSRPAIPWYATPVTSLLQGKALGKLCSVRMVHQHLVDCPTQLICTWIFTSMTKLKAAGKSANQHCSLRFTLHLLEYWHHRRDIPATMSRSNEVIVDQSISSSRARALPQGLGPGPLCPDLFRVHQCWRCNPI